MTTQELKTMLKGWRDDLNAGVDEMDIAELDKYETQGEKNAFIDGSLSTLNAVLHELEK